MESVNEDLRKILAKPNHAVNLPNNNNIDDTQNLRFKIDSLEFQIEEMKRNKEQKESISMVVDSQVSFFVQVVKFQQTFFMLTY